MMGWKETVIEDLRYREKQSQGRTLMSGKGIAVVGTGYIGCEHIKAISTHPAARLAVLCTTERSAPAAAELKETYGAERVTTRYDDVLNDASVDIVYICTPNSQHLSQAVAALDAGKAVFVEKPLAVTVAQCQEIVDAARRSGAPVMVGHGARFSTLFTTIHDLVHTGRLGDACFVESDYVHDLGPFRDLPGHDGWMDDKSEGQLPIVGGACHPLDLMRWIAGEIIEVSAFGANRNIPQAPWHDTIIACLKFASGAVGKCLTSCGAKAPYAMNFSYYGTGGTVVNDKLYLDGIRNVEKYMRLPIEVRPEDHTCPQQLDHFLQCIESGEPTRIDAVDGARSVAVCCAIVESIETGQSVKVHLDF